MYVCVVILGLDEARAPPDRSTVFCGEFAEKRWRSGSLTRLDSGWILEGKGAVGERCQVLVQILGDSWGTVPIAVHLAH